MRRDASHAPFLSEENPVQIERGFLFVVIVTNYQIPEKCGRYLLVNILRKIKVPAPDGDF
tara:strand:+ start:634 stop:813 length:180 start_codon:yes stop_codon:yes gene_type:complete